VARDLLEAAQSQPRDLLAPPPQRPKLSQWEQAKRDFRPLALGGRAIAEGGMDLVSPFADAIGMGLNAALPGEPFPRSHSENFSQMLTGAGVAAPENTGEKWGNILSRIVTGVAAGGPLNSAILKGVGLAPSAATQAAQTPAQNVLARAQGEGMVVPPAQASSRASVGSLLEGMGGTLKTGQQAAAKNQPIINSLAARAVGVSDEALSPELLQSIRTQASNAYRVIRSAGQVATDDEFARQIANAAKPFRSASEQFPSLAAANKQLLAVADDLGANGKTFDADAAVDAIQMLRDNASAAFRSGMNSQGGAYKSMANAIEGSIERHLTRMGEAGAQTLKAFRDARQLIAKTHTVEDALKGSNVDIAALGRMLKNGVPMTDELKMLGQFNQHFPGAANLTSALKARPAYSPLDAVTALSSIAGSALTGATTGAPSLAATLAAPAAYAISRPAARGLALSPMIQRGLTRPPMLPPALPWLLGGTPAAVNAVVDDEQKRKKR
jgi:hypothetical protein